MTRLMALLVLPALLLLAVACSSSNDSNAATDTPQMTEATATEAQPTAMESPEPTTADMTEDAVFQLTVTIDGEPIADSNPGVGAQIDGNNCGSGTPSGGVVEISVASDAGKAGCGTAGATVTFVLLGEGAPGGTEADETGVWDNTQVNEMTINFTTQ